MSKHGKNNYTCCGHRIEQNDNRLHLSLCTLVFFANKNIFFQNNRFCENCIWLLIEDEYFLENYKKK